MKKLIFLSVISLIIIGGCAKTDNPAAPDSYATVEAMETIAAGIRMTATHNAESTQTAVAAGFTATMTHTITPTFTKTPDAVQTILAQQTALAAIYMTATHDAAVELTVIAQGFTATATATPTATYTATPDIVLTIIAEQTIIAGIYKTATKQAEEAATETVVALSFTPTATPTPTPTITETNTITPTSTATQTPTPYSTPGEGDLIITEIMYNPAAVTDDMGEWFEIYNNTDSTISLIGLIIVHRNTGFFHLVFGEDSIMPRSYYVFGINENSETNGGVSINHQYSDLTLSNTGDGIQLQNIYGTVIDTVDYQVSGDWPLSTETNGRSIELIPGAYSAAANDFGYNWRAAFVQIMQGTDYGSPGEAPLPEFIPSATVTSTVTATVTATCTATPTPGGPPMYELVVSSDVQGIRVQTLDGYIDCGQQCSYYYEEGESVTVVADYDSCSVFEEWQGGCSGTGQCIVVMNGPVAINASGYTRQFEVSVNITGTGGGFVNSVGNLINCGDTCSGQAYCGQTLVLKALPVPGDTFSGWSGSGCSGTGDCVLEIDGSKSVTAEFE